MLGTTDAVCRPLREYWGVIAVGLLLLGIVLSHAEAVPFWDGGVYASCIRDAAVTKPFSLWHFRCADHSSIVYFFLLSLPEFFMSGSALGMFLVNLLLLVSALVAFDRLLVLLGREWMTDLERALFLALFACMPVFLSGLFHINADFGMTCFFVIYLSLLLHRKSWWASLAATCMIFSKETSVPLYVMSGVLAPVMLQGTGLAGKSGKSWKRVVPLLLPLALYGAYVIACKFTETYEVADSLSLVRAFVDHDLAAPMLASFLANIFLINFQWLMTVVLVMGGVGYAVRATVSGGEKIRINRVHLFLFLLFVGSVYVVTRVRLVENARYVLLAYPIFVLAFAMAYRFVFRVMKGERFLILTAAVVLIFLSNFRTIDPVSRRFYGVELFGDHVVLLKSAVGADAPGRDEWVYNLEFLEVDRLLSDMLRDVTLTRNEVILVPQFMDYFLPEIDRKSHRLTLRAEDGSPSFLGVDDFVASYDPYDHPLQVLFITFPNADDETGYFELLPKYPQAVERTYDHNGYRMSIYTFYQQ